MQPNDRAASVLQNQPLPSSAPKQILSADAGKKPHERSVFVALAEPLKVLPVEDKKPAQLNTTTTTVVNNQDANGKPKGSSRRRKLPMQRENAAIATNKGEPLTGSHLNKNVAPKDATSSKAKLSDRASPKTSSGQVFKVGALNGQGKLHGKGTNSPPSDLATNVLSSSVQEDSAKAGKRLNNALPQRGSGANGSPRHPLPKNGNYDSAHGTSSQDRKKQVTGISSPQIPSNTLNESNNNFKRPPPHNRKIFDPHRHPGLPPPNKDLAVPLREQCDYLSKVADFHIPNTEITYEELKEREYWRLEMQELCRDVITYFARMTNPEFSPSSVSLPCFGSLRSGFATRASDMDLALVCPDFDLESGSENAMIPRLLEQVFLHRGYGARLLTRTRVPILKLCEKPTEELMEALLIERLKWDEAQALAKSKSEKPPVQESTVKSIDEKSNSVDSPEETELVLDNEQPAPENADGPAQSMDNGLTIENEPCVSPTSKPAKIERSDEEMVRLFSLAIKEGWYSQLDRDMISEFTKCHYEAKGNLNDESLMNARSNLKDLPDILSKYREPVDNRLEFPKHGVGIQCDINFSNPLALHNTQLLRCYTICNPRIREMVLFVKAWAKKRDINSPYKGTLSSYGYVLMVLHYAINVASPPLAPNLQLQLSPVRGGSAKTVKTCNGHNVQFWRDEKQITLAAERGQLSYSNESLGSLLRGFFHYYAEQGHAKYAPQGGFFWTSSVVSLRTEGGILSKQEKGWTGARTEVKEGMGPNEKPVEVRQRFLLAIEDPFETDHNVARPVHHNGICAIRDEFRRAHRIIKNVGVIDNMSIDPFEEGRHSELDREPRYFGPNPGLAPAKPKITGPLISGPRKPELPKAKEKVGGGTVEAGN